MKLAFCHYRNKWHALNELCMYPFSTSSQRIAVQAAKNKIDILYLIRCCEACSMRFIQCNDHNSYVAKMGTMEFLVHPVNHKKHISASIYSVVIVLSEIYAMTIGSFMPEMCWQMHFCGLDLKVVSLTPVSFSWSSQDSELHNSVKFKTCCSISLKFELNAWFSELPTVTASSWKGWMPCWSLLSSVMCRHFVVKHVAFEDCKTNLKGH